MALPNILILGTLCSFCYAEGVQQCFQHWKLLHTIIFRVVTSFYCYCCFDSVSYWACLHANFVYVAPAPDSSLRKIWVLSVKWMGKNITCLTNIFCMLALRSSWTCQWCTQNVYPCPFPCGSQEASDQLCGAAVAGPAPNSDPAEGFGPAAGRQPGLGSHV